MLFILNSNGVPSVARILQIVDSTVQFSANGYSINEGQGAATITVNRVGIASDPVMVQYVTSNGTASSGADYLASSGTLTFNSGETSKTFSIPILDDAVFEGAETVNLTLGSPSGVTLGQQSSALLTIEDNETQSALSINDVSAIEGDSGTANASFTIALSPASSKTVTVNCVTDNGTAGAGSDYLSAGSSLTFTPGETSKSITVPINGDTEVEPNETFFVNLSNAANATINDNQGIGTIVNDDKPTLLTEEGSSRAIALDSVTMIREPLPILTPFNFSSDHRTRAMLFATNVDLMPGEPASVLTAQAEDSQNRIYPMTVEFVGKVPGFDWLTQIIVRLPEELTTAGDVRVSISLRGVPSNKVVLGIKSAGNGPSANALEKKSFSAKPRILCWGCLGAKHYSLAFAYTRQKQAAFGSFPFFVSGLRQFLLPDFAMNGRQFFVFPTSERYQQRMSCILSRNTAATTDTRGGWRDSGGADCVPRNFWLFVQSRCRAVRHPIRRYVTA